ncbi:glycosyltransferase 61 family protein [Tabrizicola sp. BL-A-41-H6]|uniref:glycosyltransferase 61 family protein n=1 Tax=Tabrizicola sp. BL-A-41-H6 TaxID=3421107 RepID=UPI003D676174
MSPGFATLDNAWVMAGAATLLDHPPDSRSDPALGRVALKGIGVRAADDTVPEGGAGMYRHRWTYPISISDLDTPPADMDAEAIFGGIIGPQFGHVVTQSIGRLWVVEQVDADLPILFVNANPGLDRIPGYFVDLLRTIGITNPLILLRQPTRVRKLHLGAELMNLERKPAADIRYLEWLARVAPPVTVDSGFKVYVSRSRLGPRFEQYLEEAALEAALAGEGYRVIHPETLSVPDQIAAYQRAGRLIFADGSAMHLWSLFAKPEQSAAIILRRPWHPIFRLWFKSFDRAALTVIDRRVGGFSGKGPLGRKPAVLLDLSEVWADLAESGFRGGQGRLSGAADWIKDGAGAEYPWDEVSAGLLSTRPELALL